jgi:hypothetical protein
MSDPFLPRVSRRTFLTSTMAVGGAALVTKAWATAHATHPILTVDTRVIEVNGKAAKVSV